MQRTETKGSVTKRFDSFAEFLDHVANPNPKDQSCTGSHSFTKTGSYSEAMDLARNGWPEGLSMIENLTARLESVSGSMVAKQVVQWDVAGDFADAGLFSAGVPECMGSFHEEIMPGAGKIVKILMNMSVSAGIQRETIMKRGAAVVALVDALESAGRSVEIEMAAKSRSTGGENFYTVTVPIKAAGEPVELDRMAFLLAHPSSFRRLMFACWENETEEVRSEFHYHHNGSYSMPERHKDESADIDVPEMSLERHDGDATALAWIRAELKRQGCTMEETPA